MYLLLRINRSRTCKGSCLSPEYATTTGFINFAKVAVTDGTIAQAKVTGLVTALAQMGTVVVSGTTPSTPLAGWLWVDHCRSYSKA